MITIFSTPNYLEIQAVQELLSTNAIKSQILENNQPFIDPSGNVLSYNLMVENDDADAADKIVEQWKRDQAKIEQMPWCPQCGNQDVTVKVIKHRFGSVWYLIASPILIFMSPYTPTQILPWVVFFGGVFSAIQYFRGYTTYEYTCKQCKHIFIRH